MINLLWECVMVAVQATIGCFVIILIACVLCIVVYAFLFLKDKLRSDIEKKYEKPWKPWG